MAGVASSALAADLPTTKGPPPAPYFSPPPAFNWTGFYIGVNGGWGFTQTNNDSFGNLNGGLVGGTVGRTATIVKFYQRHGLSSSVAVSSGVIYSIAGFLVQIVLAGIALIFSFDQFNFSSVDTSGTKLSAG